MALCQTDKALTKDARALASSSNGKDTHLYLLPDKQGHVFPLTMHALGWLCGQLFYISFKLPCVYILPHNCPLNEVGPPDHDMVRGVLFNLSHLGRPQTGMLLAIC